MKLQANPNFDTCKSGVFSDAGSIPTNRENHTPPPARGEVCPHPASTTQQGLRTKD